MKYLYKYPQSAFPYEILSRTNQRRTRKESEYELMDTGVFDDDRYFDIFVEYAKAGTEDILVRITVHNRAPEIAGICLLPTLWFRNTWLSSADGARPRLSAVAESSWQGIEATHWKLGEYILFCAPEAEFCAQEPELLFTENETNTETLFQIPNRLRYVKDAFHNYVVRGTENAVNPRKIGTKACALYRMELPPNGSSTVSLRLVRINYRHIAGIGFEPFGSDFDWTFATRRNEADEFYDSLFPAKTTELEKRVARQALAGALWNKQYYFFEARHWLPDAGRQRELTRQSNYGEWSHLLGGQLISTPDKWEYPCYSSWHMPFQAAVLGLVDRKFAKSQLELLLQAEYQSPSGQIPGSELNISEVTPPVHAWAAMFLYNIEKFNTDRADLDFLKRVFLKLLGNFTWWVNRRDSLGKNVFEGGFVGLDNIGPFDRNQPLPTGGYIEQADGTAWAALFCQNMLEMAVELAASDPSYEEMALKFYEHVLWIGSSLTRGNSEGFWDDKDGFYYDRIRCPDGTTTRLRVRSLIGLLPLCATTAIEKYQRDRCARLTEHIDRRLRQFPELAGAFHPGTLGEQGVAGRGLIALLDRKKLRSVLEKLLDEDEFLSPYGIRSLSRYHLENPYTFSVHGDEYSVRYVAGDSESATFGGNSNWCGPVWLPMNVMIIRALLNFYSYYGDSFKAPFPARSNNLLNLFEISQELVRRLISMFLPDRQGMRPIYGSAAKFQNDPYWRDYVTFFEYFNGDNGRGLGASHMTGWTALIAALIQMFSHLDAASFLDQGRQAAYRFPGLRKTG
jgi:hypothetical protein